MFIEIYRINGKWHFSARESSTNTIARSGVSLTSAERMFIGQGIPECKPDPAPEDCCAECFPWCKKHLIDDGEV